MVMMFLCKSENSSLNFFLFVRTGTNVGLYYKQRGII